MRWITIIVRILAKITYIVLTITYLFKKNNENNEINNN